MSAPIKREDIKAGDRIRVTSVREYISDRDSTWTDTAGTTYELIERPVILPTAPDSVIAGGGHVAILGDNGLWRADDTLGEVTAEGIRNYFPEFTLLRPVAEVAAEVLAELLAGMETRNSQAFRGNVQAVATRWAAK